MFKQRAISAVILVIIAAITLYFGGALTCLVMCAVSLIGVMELLRIYGLNKKGLGYAAYGATVFYYALLYFDLHQFILPLIAVYMLVILAIYVLTYPNYKDKEIMAAFFAFVYVGVMLSYVYLIRDMKHGLILVLLIFVSSWGNDTCAYLVGRAIGKHKMSPILSPKKSIEGLIGGIVGAPVPESSINRAASKKLISFMWASSTFCVSSMYDIKAPRAPVISLSSKTFLLSSPN